MSAELKYTISANLRTDTQLFQLLQKQVDLTMGSTYQANDITVLEASSEAVPLGAVTSPTVAYFYNADATNYYTVTDDATFLARVRPGRTVMLGLVGNETLKVQANTANCAGFYFLAKEA